MKPCVLVTDAEHAKGAAVFGPERAVRVERAPAEEGPLSDRARATRCRAVVLGVERYDGPLYEALAEAGGRAGAIIARFGVGHDGINKALARQHGIVVTNTPGALDESVAEHTLWLIGALARPVVAGDRTFRGGAFAAPAGTEVRGKTLGVIGFGAIGRRVAAKAAFGFEMKVLAADRLSASEIERSLGKTMNEIAAGFGLDQYTTDVDAVLREADIVTLHMPANEATRGFLNAERIALMKRGARLINTARGALVDENALYDALADGRLGGAGLDVFATEPYEPQAPDRDLRTLEHVVLTPHIASNTLEANSRMAEACLKNIRSFFAGRLDDMTRVA